MMSANSRRSSSSDALGKRFRKPAKANSWAVWFRDDIAAHFCQAGAVRQKVNSTISVSGVVSRFISRQVGNLFCADTMD